MHPDRPGVYLRVLLLPDGLAPRVAESPAPRKLGSDADVLALAELPLARYDVGRAVHPYPAHLPRVHRDQIVYDQRDLPVSVLDVKVPGRGPENLLFDASDVEVFAVELETYRGNVRLALGGGRGYPR